MDHNNNLLHRYQTLISQCELGPVQVYCYNPEQYLKGGGRYWDRTSDLCNVTAALSQLS